MEHTSVSVTYNIYVILMSHEVSHEDKNDWITDGQDMTRLNGTGTLRARIQSRWILVTPLFARGDTVWDVTSVSMPEE